MDRRKRWERFKKQPEYFKTWIMGFAHGNYSYIWAEGKYYAIIKEDGHISYINAMTGNKYGPSNYRLIRKDSGNCWNCFGKEIHEGRINKEIKSKLLKILEEADKNEKVC